MDRLRSIMSISWDFLKRLSFTYTTVLIFTIWKYIYCRLVFNAYFLIYSDTFLMMVTRKVILHIYLINRDFVSIVTLTVTVRPEIYPWRSDSYSSNMMGIFAVTHSSRIWFQRNPFDCSTFEQRNVLFANILLSSLHIGLK